jgi:hypothetical protein
VTARGTEILWFVALIVFFIVGLVLPDSESVIAAQWFAAGAATFFAGVDLIVKAIERGSK